jgi:tRNA(fMet)-specific endonuclease VapC
VTNPRFLLDTNICIYIRRRRPEQVLERFRKLAPGEAAVSVITFGELHYGAERSVARERALRELVELASLITVLPLPLDAARIYGLIRKGLEQRGEVIGSNDLWIAAHARAAGLKIVTNNVREFQRVPELEIENWVE